MSFCSQSNTSHMAHLPARGTRNARDNMDLWQVLPVSDTDIMAPVIMGTYKLARVRRNFLQETETSAWVCVTVKTRGGQGP